MSNLDNLFSPLRLGAVNLPNRFVMAPMTRCRADADRAPRAINAEYYAQRAGAGLILTEATQISNQGVGYPATPGIHTPKQIAGWKLVTKAVHDKGGHIFLQLWHCGRISHSSWHMGAAPVAPSAIAAKGQAFTANGHQPFETPRELELKELPGIVNDYAQGARNAIEAGFDGVEIHGANGYLIDQFLRDGTNKRGDRYGGAIENRMRFALEVTDAVVTAVGADRVGYRISPSNAFNDMADSDPKATFSELVDALNKRQLAYLHVIAPEAGVAGGLPVSFFRPLWKRTLMGNGALTPESAGKAVAAGEFDLAAIGKPFISNPDLVERARRNADLNAFDPTTFYGGSEKGYTDYPSLA